MELENQIERFIVNDLMFGDRRTKINLDDSLFSSGALDSLSLLRLIAFLEEQFNIQVDDTEVIPDNFQSINEIKAFIQNKKR